MTVEDLQTFLMNHRDEVGGLTEFCAHADVSRSQAQHWFDGAGLNTASLVLSAIERMGFTVKFVKTLSP